TMAYPARAARGLHRRAPCSRVRAVGFALRHGGARSERGGYRMTTTRRPLAAVIGSARADDGALAEARELGRVLVDVGLRVATGGLGGVMDAALQGARSSVRYREGDTLAFLPAYGEAGASPAADIVL